MMAW